MDLYCPACFNAYPLAIVCYTIPVTSRFEASAPFMPLVKKCVIHEVYDRLFAVFVSSLCPPLDTRPPISASSSWGNLMARRRPTPQLVFAAPDIVIQNGPARDRCSRSRLRHQCRSQCFWPRNVCQGTFRQLLNPCCEQPAIEAVTSKYCTSRVHYAMSYARCT